MNNILSMSLSFKVRLLLRVYARKYSNLAIEIKLKSSLEGSFSIQGIEDKGE